MKSPFNASQILLAERLRVGAILESPEGLRNPKAAREIALRSGLEADSAKVILAGLPAESPFTAAMANEAIGINPATASNTAIMGSSADAKKAARIDEIKGAVAGFNRNKQA